MNNSRIFYVKDCTLASIATGLKAQSLNEFRDMMGTIHPGCIFLHFWGGRLHSTLENKEFHNDFSHWAHHGLHDDILSERLDLLNPVEHDSVETLRTVIIDIVEERLDELGDIIPFAKREDQFHFVRSHIVIFKTNYELQQPEDLVTVLPKLSRSSIYYHFIDAIRRTPKRVNDFSTWLESYGGKYHQLIKHINSIDPFFVSLPNLQYKLIEILNAYFSK